MEDAHESSSVAYQLVLVLVLVLVLYQLTIQLI